MGIFDTHEELYSSWSYWWSWSSSWWWWSPNARMFRADSHSARGSETISGWKVKHNFYRSHLHSSSHQHDHRHHDDHVHLFRFPSGRKAAGSSRCNWLSDRLSTYITIIVTIINVIMMSVIIIILMIMMIIIIKFLTGCLRDLAPTLFAWLSQAL